MFCRDCRFWHAAQSQCRRNAPQPVDAPASAGATSAPREAKWPSVDEKDWCGEFQPQTIASS
jgi:hypothetical protein